MQTPAIISIAVAEYDADVAEAAAWAIYIAAKNARDVAIAAYTAADSAYTVAAYAAAVAAAAND